MLYENYDCDGYTKRLRPYDPRQYRAAELLLTTNMSENEIAKETGLPDGAAVMAAARMPQIAHYLSSALDAAGAKLEDSCRAIAEAHQADDMRVVSNGPAAGSSVESAGPDHSIRLKAAELNMKLRGHMKETAAANFNLFNGISDVQLAQIASGQLDPATLIDVGPRIENPAMDKELPAP